MRGEQLFPLGGLEAAHGVESLDKSPSAELFLNIARRTTPDFQLLTGDTEYLQRICRLVEGMPLGLELAASWVGLLPLSEIATEIEQSLNLLATEHSDVPQRHRSMEAAIDVSWTRLTTDQQRAFQELTIFRGGFTRAAALEITGATLPLLVTLANKSWLSYERQRDRYQIHELMRQYGASKLSSDPVHKTEVRKRHSTYFCAYLQEREADWYGPHQQIVNMGVRGEIDNIQRTWRWAANKGDVALLAQGLNSLCRFYLWEGRLKDGQNACCLAADGLSNSPAEQQADDAQLLALWSLVLAWESVFVREVAQKEELLAQSQQLLDQAAQTDQDTRAEQSFIFLAKADATRNKDLDEAGRFANLALQMFQELGNRWGEAESLLTLGVCYLFKGAHSRAKELLHDSLAIRRELDDFQGRARIANFLGLVSTYQGDFEEAETFHRQSLRLSRQLGNRWSEKMCLGQLSYTLAWAGRFSAAQEAAEQAIEIDRDLGQFPNPWRLNMLTMASANLGHYAEAQASATKALEVAKQEGSSGNISWATEHLGKIAFVGGDLAGAKRYLLKSADALAEWQHVYQALIWAILSYVVRAQGDSLLARKYLIGALRLGIEYRAISPIMCCLPVAALLAADDEQPERAIELYSLARQFGHIRNSHWFEDVACRELDEVRASLPVAVAAAAEARGRELHVWETPEELLRELDSLIDAERCSS
jgi:tetratricopeptide (TPR) repeat protein